MMFKPSHINRVAISFVFFRGHATSACPPKNKSGFSFIEVIAALVILSISLVVLLDSQGRSMDLVGKARSLETAVGLASTKITELSQEAENRGVESLREDERGDFDQEKYPTYRWHYWIRPVPEPDFKSLFSTATGIAGEENETENTNAELFAGPLQKVQEAWGDSIKELHVEVSWGNEQKPKTYELVTHLLVPSAMNQISQLVNSFSSLGGGSSQ